MVLAAVAATTLALGGGAVAQSQQGGYLGINPGGHQMSSVAPVEKVGPSGIPGSGQGGYLGLNPGAHLKSLPPAEEAAAEARMAPRAWCKSSIEASKCWANAQRDHDSCMASSPDHYEACRFALDKMHN
jgi:hypothetical protein